MVAVGHVLPNGPARAYRPVTMSDRNTPSVSTVGTRLEDLTPGARVRGVVVDVPVTVIDVAALDRAEDGRGQGTVVSERGEAWLHGASSRRPSVRPVRRQPGRAAGVHPVRAGGAVAGVAQERAEALHLAGLYVRRVRLVVLEALALQHATRTGPAGLPGLLAEPTDRERAGARALTPELFDRLPRYEGHLSRELDRSLARYRRLQDERQARESARAGAGRPGPLRARLTPWSGSVGDTGPGQQAAPSYWPGNPRELGEIVVGAGAVTAGLSVRPRTLFRAPAVGRAFLPGLPVRMTLSDAVYVPQQPSALAPALRSPGRPLGR